MKVSYFLVLVENRATHSIAFILYFVDDMRQLSEPVLAPLNLKLNVQKMMIW